MTRRTHLIWPILIVLTAGGCARQQQAAYYIDSATGQPVAMAPQQRPVQQAQVRERGLFNNFSRPAPQPYQAPVYAQQQQPVQQAYRPQTTTQQPYAPQPQVYAQQQAYRPPVQYYQPYPGTGGPYAPAPQSNPYAQARWY